MRSTELSRLGCVAVILAGLGAGQAGDDERADLWPYLLRYPDVLKELAIPDAQEKEVLAQLDRLEGPLSRPGREARRAALAEADRSIHAALGPERSRRLEEIRGQVLYVRGDLTPQSIDALDLKAESRERLEGALKANRVANGELLKRLKIEGRRSPESLAKLKREYYDAAHSRLREVLTPQQEQAIRRRLGKEFPGAVAMAADF